MKTTEFSTVNTQKIVGINSFDHFPTLGLINKPNSSVFYPIDQIQRTHFIGSFNLHNFNSKRAFLFLLLFYFSQSLISHLLQVSDDLMKPSMIKDIHVSEFDDVNGLVTLKFTAPGDNADVGTAFQYDIKASYDPKVLLDYDFHEADNNPISKHIVQLEIVNASFKNSTPNQGGYEEFLTFSTKNLNRDTVSVKIRAVDGHKNWARWSPIITVKLSRQVKLAPSIKHYEADRMSQQHLKDGKMDEADSGGSIYWELFVFLIGNYSNLMLLNICSEN